MDKEIFRKKGDGNNPGKTPKESLFKVGWKQKESAQWEDEEILKKKTEK